MKSNLHPRDTALLVKITHTKPIEIKDFVAMMGAVGGLFDGFCKSNGDSTEAQKANLYVQKIKHGSIEIFLTEAISAIALPFIENMNLVMEFAGHIKSVVEYFTKGVGEKPQLSLKELRQFHDIFAVTAGDNKGSTEIGAVHKDCSGAIYNNCTFNYFDGNSAQNQINREEDEIKAQTPEETVHERQLMTIFQMRSDMAVNTGNKAVVDSISPRPLALVFDNDELKHQILDTDENPAKNAYFVDVAILNAQGKPMAYKVVALHEIISLE